MTPHTINFDSIREHCLQLYCLIVSEYPLGEGNEPLAEAYTYFYRSSISILLMNIAINTRVLDDILHNNECEPTLDTRDYVIYQFEESKKSELNLRECINKIIHANMILLTSTSADDQYIEEDQICKQHKGNLTLKGKNFNKAWEVQIDPIALCRAILGWLTEVEESGRLHKLYQ